MINESSAVGPDRRSAQTEEKPEKAEKKQGGETAERDGTRGETKEGTEAGSSEKRGNEEKTREEEAKEVIA